MGRVRDWITGANAEDTGDEVVAEAEAITRLSGTKPKRSKQLRVVAGVRCWCIAFGATDCYCVGFDAPNRSEQDGVK